MKALVEAFNSERPLEGSFSVIVKTDRSFAALLLLFLLTETEFLPRVWRQREAEHRHGGDQQARHDQVEEVV